MLVLAIFCFLSPPKYDKGDIALGSVGLFLFVVCLIWGLIKAPPPATRFDSLRKRLAGLILTLGVLSFFVPFISLDPPVLGKAQWSAFDVSMGLYKGTLPVAGAQFDSFLLDIALLYLLIVCEMIALCFRGSEKLLILLSALSIPALKMRFWRNAFASVFYGPYSHLESWHVKPNVGWAILPFVMPSVLVVLLTKALDVSPPRSDKQMEEEEVAEYEREMASSEERKNQSERQKQVYGHPLD